MSRRRTPTTAPGSPSPRDGVREQLASVLRQQFADTPFTVEDDWSRVYWWDGPSLAEVVAHLRGLDWHAEILEQASGLVLADPPGRRPGVRSVTLMRRLTPAVAALALLRNGRLHDPARLLVTWSPQEHPEADAADEVAVQLLLDRADHASPRGAVYLYELTDILDDFGDPVELRATAEAALGE